MIGRLLNPATRRLSLCALCASMALAFAASAFPAPAAASHPFLSEIWKVPPEPPSGGALDPDDIPPEGPCGLAVDSAGGLYVSDYYHHSIRIPSFPGDAKTISGVDPLNGPCALAVSSAGRLYVNSFHQGVSTIVPSKFPHDDKTTFGAPTPFNTQHSTGVAVDQTSGNVYVNHRAHVTEYQPSGTPVLSGGDPVRIGLGTLGDAYGLARSEFPATDGYLYVPDDADDVVKVYDPAVDMTDPVGVIDGEGTPLGGFSSLHDAAVAVDRSNGHVFVVDNLQSLYYQHPKAVVHEFNAQGQYRGQLGEEATIVHGESAGLAVDNSAQPTQGQVYVTSGNSEEANVRVYGPSAPGHGLEVSRSGGGSGVVTSSPAGIRCGGACAAEYDVGETVTLTATPAPASAFVGWTVNGSGPCPGTSTCQVTMNGDVEAVAEFAAVPQLNLTTAVTGSGSGTVTSTPAGVACSSTCERAYERGAEVVLNAVPGPDSAFEGWSGGGCSGVGRCEVTMDGAESVSAEFSRREVSGPAPGDGFGVAPMPYPGAAAISLDGLAARRGVVVLRMSVSEPGAIAAAGKGLSAAAADAAGPGGVTLRLRLTAAARRALKRARSRFESRVKITFEPADGGAPAVSRRSLNLRLAVPHGPGKAGNR